MSIRYPRRAGKLCKTRQTTAYHVGDDGDFETGLSRSYTVLSTGQFLDTTIVDVAHYAVNTISFIAPDTIAQTGQLGTFLANDTIRVYGSLTNDGVYTIKTGSNPNQIVLNEQTILDADAGPYITLFKRASPSNNAVLDNLTGLMWWRDITGKPALKIGTASTGKLCWYNISEAFTIHASAADLQMMANGVKIVGGAAEIGRYKVGTILLFSGFANAVNNLPGYRITSIAVNGADLDLFLWTGINVLIAEAAGGGRVIKIVTRSIFTFCAACNAALLGGYSDWRVPNLFELENLETYQVSSSYPDGTAFPNFSQNDTVWVSNTNVLDTTQAIGIQIRSGIDSGIAKSSYYFTALVRG